MTWKDARFSVMSSLGASNMFTPAGVQAERAIGPPFDRRAEADEQLAEGVDVADVGDVLEDEVFVGEERGAHRGEGMVLRAGNAHAPVEHGTALHDIFPAGFAVAHLGRASIGALLSQGQTQCPPRRAGTADRLVARRLLDPRAGRGGGGAGRRRSRNSDRCERGLRADEVDSAGRACSR